MPRSPGSTDPLQADLFDASPPRLRREAFEEAFAAWQASASEQPVMKGARALRRTSSQATYHDLWNVFTQWCLRQQLPPLDLDDLTAADLDRFLASREEVLPGKTRTRSPGPPRLSGRYVWRALTLIDRVLAHRAQRLDLPPNPAPIELLHSRDEWRHANARRRDPVPEHLSPAQAARLVTHLAAGAARGATGVLRWQDLRNHAAVALHLGAGLTPAEARAMKLGGVVSDEDDTGQQRRQHVAWKLRVAALGAARARETPLAPWAGRVLAAWLRVRVELPDLRPDPGRRASPDTVHDPEAVLFPATRQGRAWSKLSHYQSVIDVLERSGLDPGLARGGAFRLRHTFALRQLQRQQPPERVARWLGVVDAEVMTRYLAVIDRSQRPV